MHRRNKVDMVHRRRNHMRARMAKGGHRPNQIDKVHQPPAQQVAERVRVIRQNQFRHLRLRLSDGAHRKRGKIHSYALLRVKPEQFSSSVGNRAVYKSPLGENGYMDKLAMLNEILNQNPSDAVRYGLAMEYARLRRHRSIARRIRQAA